MKNLVFASSDPTVATVSPAGRVRIVAEDFDTCIITATSVDGSHTCELFVVSDADYEIITGLSLSDGSVTPQVVYLQVDVDKTCKVVLPDGSIITSIAGGINTTWTGAAGSVTLIVDKTSQNVYFGDYDDTAAIISDYIGDLYTICNGVIKVTECPSLTSVSAPNAINIQCPGCASLTSISAPNAAYLDCPGCASLTSISAPNAAYLDCSGCALTAVAIAEQLASTIVNIADFSTVNFDFSVGTNAAYSTWSAQAQADAQTITTAGGIISYNE